MDGIIWVSIENKMNTDFLISNNDAVMVNGDFATGASDVQHVKDTINGAPGWFKEFPSDGVGITGYLNSGGQEQAIARSLKVNLESDGYDVNNPTVVYDGRGGLIINPNAENVNTGFLQVTQ